MKKIFNLFLVSFIVLFLISLSQAASYTNVTATLTDTGGTTWANGSYRVELIPPFGNPATPTNQGTPTTGPFSGFLNGSGALAVTLDDNIAVTPSGTTWKFTLCPNATTTICSVSIQVVHGPSMNLSASINADLSPVTVTASPTIFRAYADTEVTGGQGSIYWRVTDNTLRGCSVAICNGTSWITVGGSGGGCAEGVCIQNFPAGNQTIAGGHTFSVTNGSFNINGPGVLSVFGSPSLLNIRPNDANSFALTISDAANASGEGLGVLVDSNGDTFLSSFDSSGNSVNSIILRGVAGGSNIRFGPDTTHGVAVSPSGSVFLDGTVQINTTSGLGAIFGSIGGGSITLVPANFSVSAFTQTLIASTGQVPVFVTAPGTSSTSCATGVEAFDSGFMYKCIAANTWKRVAISTF